MTCQAPGCKKHGPRLVPCVWRPVWWHMCETHAERYETHNRIVERILSIPPRD